MDRWIAAIIIFAAVCAQASDERQLNRGAGEFCSDSWYQYLEQKVATGDNQGHGPDVGSHEWKSVIEFKLGIRDDPNLPDRDSETWCRHIDQIIRERAPASSQKDAVSQKAVMKAGPSFNCGSVDLTSIEEMVCKDAELSALDRKLSIIFTAAAKKAANEHPAMLKAEQRGWIKGRNECWKADDKRSCARDHYQLRIAELQARYRLVEGNGPYRFICDENPANEVIVAFFQTEPPTMIAEYGDDVLLMYLQPSASGTKYQGRNETFWEHQGVASITWGYGAPQMRCKKVP